MLPTLTGALPLTQALREFFPAGRTGNPIALSTAYRWIHRGVLSASGNRVRLHAVRIGGVTYIRPDDAERFLLALNEAWRTTWPSRKPTCSGAPWRQVRL